MRTRNILKLLIFTALLASVGCGTERNPFLLPTISQSESLKSDREPEGVVFGDDFAAGARTATEQSRPMLVFFMLPQCVGAQQMMQTTFSDKEVGKLSQRFVCVLVDSTKNAAVCEERNVTGFPTILLISPQGIEIQRMSGHQNADHLSVQMQVALQSTVSHMSTTVRGAVPLNR